MTTMIVLITIGVILYFLPTVIAILRHRVNTGSIFVLNLFLGWSVIAWVISMVWALSKDHINVYVKEVEK